MDRILENSKSLNFKHGYTRNLLVFIICSTLGIVSFFVPIPPSGKVPFEIIYKTLLVNPLGANIRWLTLFVVVFNLLGLLYGKSIASPESFFYKKFHDYGKVQTFNVVVGFIFILMAVFNFGISYLNNDLTVKYMIYEIFPFTYGCLTIGGMLLPLLTAYGILEFVGILLEPIMRPVLKLPGKAAIDSIASIVGAAVVGIYLTSRLYHDKQYTQKEALSIATGFSLNSVGYCAFLVSVVGLSSMFNKMFIMYLIIAYIMAMIIVRIPPVSRHKNVFADGTLQTPEMQKENIHYEHGVLSEGLNRALLKADTSDNVVKDLLYGAFNGFMVFVEIIPMMAVIGGIALSIYHFTPIIKWMSLPLVPYIKLFGIPEAQLAAESIFLGGVELAMPAFTIVQATSNQAVHFFVVMVSMVQVLYITETMLPIISFGIPCKLWELLLIWLQRTLIAIPLVALLTHILFL